MDVRLPDGTLIQGVPDTITRTELATKLKANGMAVPADWLSDAPKAEPSISEKAGAALKDTGRQIGLTARYALEGAPGIVDTLATPLRMAGSAITGRPVPPVGGEGGVMSRFSDAIGLPSPETPNERTIGAASRAGFGAIGGVAGFSRAATGAAPGAGRNVLQQLADKPGLQAIGAGAGGAAGQSVKEAGGDAADQFGAALLGGVGAGLSANALTNAAKSGSRALRNAMTPRTEQVRAADQQITMTLNRAGIDWSAVPERVRQELRGEVADALATDRPLNEAALRRLLVFKSTGTTPTVGMLTQDPGAITREMNLAKTGANSRSVDLQRLPRIQNENVNALIGRIDEAGAATGFDPHTEFGGRGISALQSQVGQRRGEINSLYSAARDSEGRSLDLDRAAFATRANQLLDDAMVGGALPKGVSDVMNWIATNQKPQGMHGSIPMPFTVDIAEQIKTKIGNLQRGTNDGGARMALGLVRQALDETPLVGSGRVNPGNLPEVPGTVPPSTQAGQEAIDAFNRARSANRRYMQSLEANPALAAVDDATAALRDNPQLRSVSDIVGATGFGPKYLTSKSVSPGEVKSLVGQMGQEGEQAARSYVLRYLRDAATNKTDDITKFSNTSYRAALRDIGDPKLRALGFSPEEIQHLRDIGDAAKYMQAQPAGAAVNNSNSGALILGRGLDALESIAGKVPFVGDTIQGRIQGAMQSHVLNPRNALTMSAGQIMPQGARMNPLFAAAIASPEQGREDQRRQRASQGNRAQP